MRVTMTTAIAAYAVSALLILFPLLCKGMSVTSRTPPTIKTPTIHRWQSRHAILPVGCNRRGKNIGSRIGVSKKTSTTLMMSSSSSQTNLHHSTENLVNVYVDHWNQLLTDERHEQIQKDREQRAFWSTRRLEAAGLLFRDCCAVPESELYGEKLVRIEGPSLSNAEEKLTRGDVMLATPQQQQSRKRRRGGGGGNSIILPRECSIVDAGSGWATIAVGSNWWPPGITQAYKRGSSSSDFYSNDILLDLEVTSSMSPLLAQRKSLDKLQRGKAGSVARILAETFSSASATGSMSSAPEIITSSNITSAAFSSKNNNRTIEEILGKPPPRLALLDESQRRALIENAIDKAVEATESPDEGKTTSSTNSSATTTTSTTTFQPNRSQRRSISYALNRTVSSLQGPPGCGKTKVAALLIASALQIPSAVEVAGRKTGTKKKHATPKPPPPARVLAVAHSNGAADVLLEALLDMGIPAVRAGRPAAVAESVRHRTITAMADRHPDVIRLRERQHRKVSVDDNGTKLSSSKAYLQSSAASLMADTNACIRDVIEYILNQAPVVVASCIGAAQIITDFSSSSESEKTKPETISSLFSLVVLDEAAQTTEPALVCALATAQAEQLVMVGDTKQLPPTIPSEDPKLRAQLGVSPMSRLETRGVSSKMFRIQYRMHPMLLEFPSKYFYNNRVVCHDTLLLKSTTNESNDDDNDVSVKGFDWPKPNIPLAFIHCGDTTESIHDFGGKSNPFEAKLIVDIVKDLLQANADLQQPKQYTKKDGGGGIAVITPYSKQVQRIRTLLTVRGVRSDVCRVGTVDAFQGQEVDVVLFSAVRSNEYGEIGFLRDARRLCVAVTRAKRALILVGNTSLLQSSSHHWMALVQSCRDRGCILDVTDFRSRNTTIPSSDEENNNTDNSNDSGSGDNKVQNDSNQFVFDGISLFD